MVQSTHGSLLVLAQFFDREVWKEIMERHSVSCGKRREGLTDTPSDYTIMPVANLVVGTVLACLPFLCLSLLVCRGSVNTEL